LRETTVPRIRFGSIDPRLVTEEFIGSFANPRLMPHLHFSLQSGSEKILKKMGRPIKIAKIKNIVRKLRAINPLFNFSADIIVGYPGETEDDFKKSLKLAKKLQLCKIHYFPYSSRPGTPANQLQPLPPIIIKNRLTVVAALNARLQRKARKCLIDKHLTVFFEYAKNNVHYGYTPNFIRMKLRSKNDLTGKTKEFIIKKSNFAPLPQEG
jgi:threonylcarbamoyladenosine tRNA methylthiotransferase MtaB